MKNTVEITNNQRSLTLTRHHRQLIQRTVDAVLKSENVPFACEVAVSIVNNNKIKKLNMEFRQIANATDVLSFPSGEYDKNADATEYTEDEPCYLGDIAISLERANEQSLSYGHSLEREIAFLTAHSVLHLLGYDHIEEQEQIEMFVKQEAVLSSMGVTR